METEREPILEALAAEVAVAREKLLTAARADVHRPWNPDELRRRAGVQGPTAMIATCDLVAEGVWRLDSRLRVCMFPEEWE